MTGRGPIQGRGRGTDLDGLRHGAGNKRDPHFRGLLIEHCKLGNYGGLKAIRVNSKVIRAASQLVQFELAVVVGKHVVLNTGCPQLEADLKANGYEPHATELGEFIKAGGSAKCLTLRLDGEDAARWP